MKLRVQNVCRVAGLAACVGFTFLALWLWRDGEKSLLADWQVIRHPTRAVQSPEAVFRDRPTVDVGFLRENALFYSARSFYQPPPPIQTLPPPDYEFSGSMLSPQGKRVAFLRNKTDKSSHPVHTGDELDGWQVTDVTATRVVLTREGTQVDIGGTGPDPIGGLVRTSTTAAPAPARNGQRILGSRLEAGLRPETKGTTALVPRFYQAPP